MPLTPFLCTNCGYWRRLPSPPAECPLCLDFRHAPPEDGWAFLSEDEVAARTTTTWTEVEPGRWRFDSSQRFHIGPSGYLLEHPDGNVCFEAPNWLSDDALDFMASLGGVAVATASHPHVYGALHRVVDRFSPEVPLPVPDEPWALAFAPTQPYDDVLPVADGLTLHVTGGHFDGHQVLHDAERSILFCGDALKLDLDPDDERRALGISTHKAFVRQVPLSPAELRRYREVFAGLDFEQTWTPFEQGANAGRDAALALLDELLQTGSHPRPVVIA
jgi:glyoxylase-like metal-dependent hydrolase (beta-lactamase superfamily II)